VFCARDTPAGRALRESADSQEEELCEFYHLKEASTEGAFTGLLNTQNSALEFKTARGIVFSIYGGSF
jgi:hypothetical protein